MNYIDNQNVDINYDFFFLNKPKWNILYHQRWFISHKVYKRERSTEKKTIKCLVP